MNNTNTLGAFTNQNIFNGLFGKLSPGMCRLSMNGNIAVRTQNGTYKSYNLKKNTLTNCTNFVFDIGDDLFFIMPTNKVVPGDIIIVNGLPKCVVKADGKEITVIDYETSEVKTILPERHIFMGNVYFYGKIMSMFGKTNFLQAKSGPQKMMQMMMFSEMMKNGRDGGNQSGLTGMLPMMMLMNGGGNMFEGMFDFGFDDDDDAEEAEVVDEELEEEEV